MMTSARIFKNLYYSINAYVNNFVKIFFINNIFRMKTHYHVKFGSLNV